MGLFSKKPGGTFFGNLLRVGGNAVSQAAGVPGLLGTGANKIEVGQTKTNGQLIKEATAAIPAAPSVTIQTPSPNLNSVFSGTPGGTTPGGNNNILLYIGIG